MSKLDTARERTDAKLRYAGIHLDELKTWRMLMQPQGVDWEKAHQESFLYHLLGVRDSLLQEINLSYKCGLSTYQVRKTSLLKKFEKMGIQCQALRTLGKLEGMKSTWISIAARLRNVSTHQKRIARQYVIDGLNMDPVFLRDPGTGDVIETDFTDLFEQWLNKMKQLVDNLRSKMPGDEDA